jgi:hypothetical protein
MESHKAALSFRRGYMPQAAYPIRIRAYHLVRSKLLFRWDERVHANLDCFAIDECARGDDAMR